MTDLTPGSPEWCRRVSPSKAAAILGASPFESQRAMFHMMRGEAPWPGENEAMERGNLCEGAVLAWWRKHHEHANWREQVTLTIGDWLVATPDAIAEVDGVPEVIQAKTTGSQMDEWGDPGTDVVPAHVLVQVYLEMEVCHRNEIPVARANIPVLGGYRNLFANYVVEYDPAAGAELMRRMEVWRDLLASDTPPPLDDTVSTWDAVRKVNPDIDHDLVAECTPAEAREYVEAMNNLKAAEARALAAKSFAVDRMGRARHLEVYGLKVARRQPNKTGISLVQTLTDTSLIAPELETAS